MAGETILGGAPEAPQGIVENQTVAPVAPAAPAAAPAPVAFDKLVAADGGLAENWRDALPEDIRNEPSLQSIKHFGTLAKSYVHAQKSIGAEKLVIPGENATEEERGEFYKALGRPEAAEKYEFKPAEGLPEGIAFDDAAMKGFREEAFKLGLSQEQYNAAINFQAKFVAEQQQKLAEAAEGEYVSTVSKLKGEFGGRFDEVVSQCNKAVETFGIKAVLEKNGLLNNYDIIKMLASIGGKISESKLHGGPDQMVQSSPEARIAEIRADLKGPYYDNNHPRHAQVMEEMRQLLDRQARAQKNVGGNN